MGKKPVVVSDRPKKKSACCTCLLTVWVVMLVLLAGGTAVGCFFLHRFTKEHYDMGLGECLGVVNGLYWASDKKIVDYGYTDADAAAFDAEIKHQLFLKDDAELDLTQAVKILLQKDEGEKDETLYNALRRATSGAEDTESGQENNKLLDFVASLMTRENVDYARLSAYQKDKHDEYLFSLNDKQLAAFVNRVLAAATDEIPEVAETLEKVGMQNLSDAVAVRQIRFAKRDRAVLDENGLRGETKTVTMADITVQIKLSDIAKSAMRKYIPNSFLAGLAHFGLKTLLPNNLYITASIGLTDNVGIELSLNRITGEKVAGTYKLIKGITGEDVEAKLNQMATESIAPSVEKVDEIADFSKVEDGTLKFDTYGVLANMASKDEAGENKLTGQDVLFAFSRLVTAEAEAVTPEHDYRHWYVFNDGDKSGQKVYVADPADVTDQMKKVDYQQAFIDELKNKYCLKTTKPDGGEYTFAEIVAAFGGEGALTDMLDLSHLGETSAGKTEDELRITLTDKMLAAIVAETLKADSAAFGDVKFDVEQVALLKRVIDETTHDFVDLRAAVDFTAMLGDMGGMSTLLNAFLPEKIVIGVQVDVTTGLPDGVVRIAPTLTYNNMSAAETAELLAVFDKLGIEGFNTQDLTAMIADSVNGMLDSMRDYLVLTFEPSKLAEEKKDGKPGYEDVADDAVDILLPSVYGLLEKTVFTKDGETVAAADIKAVFDNMYKFDSSNAQAAERVEALQVGLDEAAANYDALLRSLQNNYYLKAHHADNITDFDTLLTTLSTLDGEFDAGRFDVDKLRAESRPVGSLRPVLSAAELARLFVEKMDGTIGGDDGQFIVEGVSIEAAAGYDAALKVLVRIDVAALAGVNVHLIPVNRVYATLTVYITDDADKLIIENETTAYPTTFAVNDMSETEQNNLMRMLGMFGGEIVDPETIAKDMGQMLYEQMNAMREKMGDVEFVAGVGIRLPDFYRFLARAAELDPGAGYGETEAEVAENLRRAVQGMYAGESAFNYSESALLFNPIATQATPNVESGKYVYTDKQMGYLVQQAIANGDADTKKLGTLKQLVVVQKGAKNAAEQAAYDMLNGFDGSLNAHADKDLIALTFEMPIDEFADTADAGIASALLPETVYATVLLAYDGTQYSSVYFRFNNMTEAQQTILRKIAGLDTFDISSIGKTAQCTELLEQFRGAVYGSAASGGIGQVACDLIPA